MTTDHADPQPNAPSCIFGRTGADLTGLDAPAGVHPAATLLPEMRADEKKLLRRSLAAGWRADSPPILVDGQHRVIDGRHRVAALGLPVEQLIAEGKARVVEWDDDTIVGHVLTANLARRHLTIEERQALYRRLRRIYGKRPQGRPRTPKKVPAGTFSPPTTQELAARAGISLRQAKRVDAELDGRKPKARRAAVPESEPAKAEPAVAEPVPPAAAREQEDAMDASWSAFVRLDREGQLPFARRALAHLGHDQRGIEAVLAGVEKAAEAAAAAVERSTAVAEAAAEPAAEAVVQVVEPAAEPGPRVSAAEAERPAVAEPESDADAVTVHPARLRPGGRPHLYAGVERLPRRRMERAGYGPAGAHTYKGVPGTLLRNADDVVKYWSPDWNVAGERAAA